ncbi:MAG: DNA repair protein RecO C-terminal domain-containing protein, partial [Candidatus Aerophobetes bacterium]|nr:DNA repair protein RecO C-terminal domain-containing protein [Candidatus Aerophobetes bacterium]
NLLIHSFELKFLDILGYRPCLEKCINCGKKLEFIPSPCLSIRGGGILCEACQEKDKKRLAVSRPLIKLMEHLLYLTPERGCQLKIDKKIRRELKAVLQAFLSYQLRGEMLTPVFIHNLERLEGSSRLLT